MRNIRVFWEIFCFPYFFKFSSNTCFSLFMSLRYWVENPSILGQLFFPNFFSFIFYIPILIAGKMNHVFTNS